MSGGTFEYLDSNLRNEIFDYACKPWNALEDREISEITWDLLNLLHEYDWYKSGDTCREDYRKAKAKFKKKWLNNPDVRVKNIVDNAVQELRQELYDTYDLKEGHMG